MMTLREYEDREANFDNIVEGFKEYFLEEFILGDEDILEELRVTAENFEGYDLSEVYWDMLHEYNIEEEN